MTRPIRIAHVIESLGCGGAERLLITSLRHLDRDRFQHHVVYLFERHDLASELAGLGIASTCLRMRSFFDWRRGLLGLRRALRALEPDIVHTVLQRADMYGRLAARAAWCRTVVTTLHECPYNPEVFIDNPGLNRFKYALFKRLDKWTARACNDAFIVVSRATGRNLCTYFRVRPELVRLLYSSVDMAAIDGLPFPSPQTVRTSLGILPGEVLLLNVGRLFQQKGQRYAVRAMPRVLAACPGAKLLIRGDGPDGPALTALADELGVADRVRIVDGWRSHAEVLALMRAADVFVFPSLYEGLGIALIEAMALGKACVASNVGPIPEVVAHAGAGRLVPPMDAGALADAIVQVLQEPATRVGMGRQARRIVEAKFDVRTNIKLLEQAYSDLVAGAWARQPSAFARPQPGRTEGAPV